MKVRAKSKNNVTEVKLLADHPMESGRRKGGDGKLIPEHYITELTAEYKNEVIFTAFLGPAVSKDPYLKFSFKGGTAGEKLTLKWVDNKNETETSEADIS